MKPNTTVPFINRLNLQQLYGTYEAPSYIDSIPLTPYQNPSNPMPTPANISTGAGPGKPLGLDALRNLKADVPRFEPSKVRSLSEMTDPTGRYPQYTPNYDNEDAYAQNQSWMTQAFNGVTKGTVLAGTTFLQTTVGLVNGTIQALSDGRAASFYDNEFNRSLDDVNKALEVKLASYEKKSFRDAAWYSPDYLLTGNFVWEGIVKNLGFAVGAAASGAAFGTIFKGLGAMSRVVTGGRAEAAIVAAEEAIALGEGATGIAGRVAGISKGLGGYTNILDKGYRAAVAGFATSGEAGIEAYHNLNEFRDKAIEEYKKANNGQDPSGEDLVKINRAADEVGNMSFKANMALLSVTNYIQFPTILGKTFKTDKVIANGRALKTRNIKKLDVGDYAAPVSKLTRAGNIIKNPYVFSYAEAFEEGSQFAISKSTADFYDKRLGDEDTDNTWFDSIVHGIKETVNTDEGMKNILIGGLSGAIMLGKGRITESFDKKENTRKAIESFKVRDISDFISDTYDSALRGKVLEKDYTKAVEEGDVLAANEKENDYVINYLLPRIKYGRHDLVLQDIQDMKDLAIQEGGWEQLMAEGKVKEGDTKEDFFERLENLEETSNVVASTYNDLNLKYSSLVDEKDEKIYSKEVMDKLLYSAAKIAYYNKNIPKLTNEIKGLTVSLEEVFKGNEEALKEAQQSILNNEDLNASEIENEIEKLNRVAVMSQYKKRMLKEYGDIKASPAKHKTKTVSDVPGFEDKKELKVKTGTRDPKTVIAGEPYYLVENVKFSRDGVRPIRKAHKIKILKENEDGSYEVEFENGIVKTVSPEQMAEYNLGKVDTTDANPKAKFVLENLDEEYVHFGIGQDGKKRAGKKGVAPAKGVLEYNSKDDIVEFIWQTPTGKTYRREVPNTMFVAKKGSGFEGGMVRKTGTTLTEKQKKAEKNFFKAKLSLSEKLGRRMSVANTLYKKLLKEVTTIANKIETNNNKLTSLDEEISNAYKTKDGKPRKRITKTILNAVKELESLKETIPAENERLKEQQILLEGELDAVKEFVDSVDLMSSSGKDMINDIKDEMENLKSLVDLTKDAIKQTEQQLPLIEEIYQRALKLLNNFVDRMVSLNPTLPLSIEEYRGNMEKYLGEAGAEGIISRKEGFTEQILDIENTILSYTEGLKYPQHEGKFLELSKSLQEMQKKLPEMEANLRAQQKILDSFIEFFEQQKSLQKAEENLKDNGKVNKQLDTSLDKSGEVKAYDPDFVPNPKKSTVILPTASIGIQDGHSHQDRANLFGFKLPKLQEAGKSIEAVYVNKKNEAALGMSGLIKKLSTDEQGNLKENVDPKTIIVVVMVTETDDATVPVDIEGNPITGDTLAEGIYQVMPLEKLTWDNGESMFREGTPQNVIDEVTLRYAEWREEILARDKVDSKFEPLSSFGILSFEEDQRTSAVDAGFVESDTTLQGHQVINVSTTQEELTKGTTTYPNPYKRVLIETDNGYAQLQNEQHTEEQVTTIYRAIYALADELTNNKEGLKSAKASRLLDYLKGIVYWGLPTRQNETLKESGHSSVFFRTDPGSEFPTLFVGNKGKQFVFTPLGIKNKSGEIIEALKELYSNTNYVKIRNLDKAYEEIISMDEEGEITETRLWPNYQTYLLSANLPNKTGTGMSTTKRKNIPLTTVANPITESEPVNRTGIYFYNPEMEEHYTVEAKKKTNLKTDQVPKDIKVSDEEVVKLVESKGQGYIDALDKSKTKEDRTELAKKIFIQLALNEILQGSPEIQSIADPAEKKEILAVQIAGFNKKIKNEDTDKVVASMWDAYANLTQRPVEAPKPVQKDLMAGMGEMSFGETEETPTAEPVQEEVKGENISSKGSEFSKKLTNPGNDLQVEYKGKTFRNAEHAYQTWKSGEFDKKAFDSTAFKPQGSKPANKKSNYDTMVEILTAKLTQHPSLIKGINERGGKEYLNNSEHKVTGDPFWEGQNKFIEALTEAYNNIQTTEEAPAEDRTPASTMRRRKGRKRDYRKKLKEKYDSISTEDWTKVEVWLKANFPNLPVYRLKTIIKNTNGDQAWGMFSDGAIYVYENAEGGTVYHEVFEAVWKMFTPVEEQTKVIEEFKSREGEFKDRPSGKNVSYAEATDGQIKEQLAEEFRNFINKKGLPKSTKGFKAYILKLFKDLKNFIKNIFISPKTDINDLFKKINTGYYQKNMPYARELSYAKEGIINSNEAIVTDDAEFSKLPGITDAQVNDVVEEMIYTTISKLIKDDKNLFSLEPIKVNDASLLADVKETLQIAREGVNEAWVVGDISIDEKAMELIELYQLQKDIKKNFPAIKELFINRIKSYGVTLDENDSAQIQSEEKTRNSDYMDATKVDKFKKMNNALKLLFNTVAEVDAEGYDITSSIGGVKTLTFGEVSNTLMKELYTSRTLPEMQERFAKLAENEPNYRRLYERFFKASYTDKGVGFKNIDSIQSFRMISGLWKTFSLHAPLVKNVFILENGDIEVGDANLATEGAQLRTTFLNSIILKSKSGTGFFTFSPKLSSFNVNKDKLSKYPLRATKTSYKKFLAELGIDFSVDEMNKLSGKQYEDLKEIVNGFRKSLNTIKAIRTFSSTSLDLHGRLLKLGLLKAAATNAAYESTYFNVAGERTQTFIGGNSPGRLFRTLSQVDNINELEGTEFDYLIPGNDVFSEHSIIISKMFDKDGYKIAKVRDEELMSVGYVGGTINEKKGRNTQSSKLKFRDRFLQEINLNLKGWYLNLVPGDSSTEWMTFMGNHIDEASLNRGFDEMHNIFKNYFISEVNLSREGRDFAQNKQKTRNTNDLRFLQSILEPATIVSIKRSKATAETLYKRHEAAIKRAVEATIETNKKSLESTLNKFQAIQPDFANKGKFRVENVNIQNVTEQQLSTKLTMLTVNYMINNIEQHKLVYGEPYQYKDELKRTKSFQSPRQEILNSSTEVNTLMDKIWNKNYTEDSLGRTNFIRDYFRTATLKDIEVVSEFAAYGIMEETDGGGIISLKGNRNFKIRSSDWTEANERQFDYEINWEEMHKDGLKKISDGEMTEEGLFKKLSKLKNPGIKSTFTSIKPVVTGNKYSDSTSNSTILDKYALYPLSYRMMIGMKAKNGVKLHNKMQNEDIDYVIFNTGRKVGAYNTASSYNEDGSFNTEPYPENTIINVGFSTLGLQTEVPSKDNNQTTRGSQVTKIITMDRMDAGVPIDFMEDTASFSKRYKEWNALSEDEKESESDLYTEIKLNKELLEGQIQHGYETILNKLGIVEKSNGKVVIDNYEKTVELIKSEVLLRESNDNIIDALDTFMKSSSVLEATPAYRQISNILYSIVDKNILHPKITGGMKVQLPSTFWEENRLAVQEINGKKGYTSDALGFYVDEATGDNVMEIYAGRWFPSNMSDEALLKYLNTTKEGQEVLRGFAFRIPTQNMNSIDAFRIKKFLPEEFGDNVVVPSAIVGKVGSDFDIDKLSMYLKNVFSDTDGLPKIVPYFGIGMESLTKAKEYAKAYYLRKMDVTKTKLEKETRLRDLFSDIYLGNNINYKKHAKWIGIFKEWFESEAVAFPSSIDEEGRTTFDMRLAVDAIEAIYMDKLESLGLKLDELEDADALSVLIEKKGIKFYEQGMQNAYIESNIRLLTAPSNHAKLTSPNSAKVMEELARDIHKKKGNEELEYSNPINFLDRTFMTELRHSFVAGKGGIGIAAVGQTNNANNQQQLITIDKSKIKLANEEEEVYLGDGEINFKKYNSVILNRKKMPTLSMIKNQAGEYISDLLGMFIDGYVDIAAGPWIMQMGATPETTGTWQFLLKIGVPLKDVAYFMNQPIIQDYLQMIENKGYSWLFIKDYADELKSDKYGTSKEIKIESIPSTIVLNKTIGATKLSDLEKAQQQFYLDEFLKYGMMARHLFYFTQGTNHDTASFNNPYLITKKEEQLKVARNSIISNPDDMLKSTFLGKTREALIKSRNVLNKILISDRPNTREVVNKALMPYIHLSNREFVKMAEKVVTNLFDWAVQTQTGLNDELSDILINKDNIAQRLSKLIKDKELKDPLHPLYNNYVLKLVEIMPSKLAEAGGTDNVRIKAKNTEVYDQNRMIYAFRELKEFLGDESDLYQGLVKLAILQSGLSPSTLSFTSLIPFEDFSGFYNETLSLLEKQANLGSFNDMQVFERNNWNNSDIVGYKRADWIPTDSGMKYNPGMNFLNKKVKEAIKNNSIPQLTTMPVTGTAKGSHIVYSWEDQVEDMVSKEERAEVKKNGGDVLVFMKKKKEQMKKDGDFSFMHKALMQRVKKSDGSWYTVDIPTKKGEPRKYYVYKAINAWGNGPRANEFYDVATTSVINNGFMEVEEASDASVLEVYTNSLKKPSNKKRVYAKNALLDMTKDELLEDYSQTTGLPLGEQRELNISMKGNNVTVNNKTFPMSFMNAKKLVSLGYTEVEAGKILQATKYKDC